MLKNVLSQEMEAALSDVVSHTASGRKTASHPTLKQASIEAYKASYKGVKGFLELASQKIDLDSHNIKFGMGNWISSGWVFPHVWGALIPEEGKRVSAKVPQLGLIRRHGVIGWGLFLSDKGQADQEIVELVSDFIGKSDWTKPFLAKGFKVEVENSALNPGKPTALHKTLDWNTETPDQVEKMVLQDFEELFPYFIELVGKLRDQDLIAASDSDEDEIENPKDSKESLLEEWNIWWKGTPTIEDKKVPEYLVKELGPEFQSVQQKWDIGRREALLAIEDAKAGKLVPEPRKHSLVLGALRRTNFTGGWRSKVWEHFEDLLKMISEFAIENPKGCTEEELEVLLSKGRTLCGYRLKSFMTRFLCDLQPETYFPTGSFTKKALAETGVILGIRDIFPKGKPTYEEVVGAAKKLALRLSEPKSGFNLYVFDHFLAWTNKYRKSASASDILTEPQVQYWVMAPGEGARLWKECIEHKIISLGWDEMGDLSEVDSLKEVKELYIKNYKPDKNPKNNTLALFEFSQEMRIGDIVFAKDGQTTMVGIGKVVSDYIFDESRSEHKHIREVEWTHLGPWTLAGEDKFVQKTLTNVTEWEDYVQRIFRAAGISELATGEPKEKKETIFYSPYSEADAAKELFISEDTLSEIIESLKIKKNVILQGPPGVGKTFIAERISAALVGSQNPSFRELVQFHPSYSYEDFVQGYRPNGGQFTLEDGIFLRFCEKARNNLGTPHVFMIDEINRGNLSKIFGELLMLIEEDKRDKRVKLTYSKASADFSIPQNVYILGTMNTADRSLTQIDYALRRRFTFFSLKPEFESPKFVSHLSRLGVKDDEIKFLQGRMKALNSHISEEEKYLGPGFEIGHSYFCKKPLSQNFQDWYLSVVRHEISHLLREYWFDDRVRAENELSGLKAS